MSTDWDVVIVGAGPVGGLAGRELASRGLSVLILEEHDEIGKPFQCTGLVTPETMRTVGLEHTVLSDVTGARIHSPGGMVVEVGTPGSVRTHVVCRKLFDQGCVRQAVEAGAEVSVGTRAIGLEVVPEAGRITVTGRGGERTLSTRLVIGCDGAHSWVRRTARLGRPTEWMVGFQVEATGYEGVQDRLDMYTGRDVAPGLFAWAVPNGRTHRLGVWVRPVDLPPGQSAEGLHDALRAHAQWGGRFREVRETARFCGPLPCGMIKRLSSERVMVLGDAAGMAKPTTGGGIGPGFRAVLMVADRVASAVREDRLSAKALARTLRPLEALRKELERGRVLRDLFVTDHDDEALERVFRIFARPEVVDLINQEGEIDRPVRLGLSLLRRVPQFRPLAARAAWAVLTN